MNSLVIEKYNSPEVEDDMKLEPYEQRIHGYGVVTVLNPHYMKNGDEEKYLYRKPTPEERREIILNTVIECNGRMFKIPDMAWLLGVSDRTVQKILRDLERERLIKITAKFTKNGAQKSNAYRYIGPPCEKYGSGLTLTLLHDRKQNVGFRDWDWKLYEFYHDKTWHSVFPLCRAKFERNLKRREYLEKNNLPLVIPKNIRYLTLRHCYCRGKPYNLKHNFIFSKDGSLKLNLFPLDRTETVKIFGHTFSVSFGGTNENPQVTISNAETGEQLGVFSWFQENIVQGEKALNKNLVEQYFIVGDFTTR